MATRLGITWQISDSHGWGVFGLNLALNLIRRGGPTPLLFTPPLLSETPAELLPFIDEQAQVQAQVLDPAGGNEVRVGGVTILHALAGGFRRREAIKGGTDIGFVFFEQGGIDDDARARATEFRRILAGSSWNRDYARAHGVDNIEFVAQGVDTSVFHPGPASGAYRDRFTVFSGGKLEPRKGQDLVLAAFKVFHARHPEALLVTSWRNAWPESAQGMSASVHIEHEPETGTDGELDIRRWATANGIADDAFVDLGWVPNTQMATILRDMDVAVFANRCEGGTNLVAMEAMATGVPCLLSANTGHLDIIAEGNCYALHDQRPVAPAGSATEMWRESQVDEIVAQLEAAHAGREEARRIGEAGAAFMAGMSWEHQTEQLLDAIRDLV
jgi:glycosyltransferase involved in cell wall biosynthesis